jgi:hypothetical protein
MSRSTRFGSLAVRGALVLAALCALSAAARADPPNEKVFDPVIYTDAAGNTVIVWHIAAPNVSTPTPIAYQQITFLPGDRVLFKAGGFLRIGGDGGVQDYVWQANKYTWAGTVAVAGLTDNGLPQSGVLPGMIRLSTLLANQNGQPMIVQGSNQATLFLGYEDSRYDDNSYGGLQGNQIAWVTITIVRPPQPPAPPKGPPPGKKPWPAPSDEILVTASKMLQDPSVKVRIQAVDRLIPLEARGHFLLAGALRNAHSQVRAYAAWRLGTAGPQARPMIDILREVTKRDPDAKVRQAASEAVRQLDTVKIELKPGEKK